MVGVGSSRNKIGPTGVTEDTALARRRLMKNDLITAVMLTCSFATPAFADYYIVQDTGTRRCTIVEQRPTVTTQKIVGPDGTVYKTREEATTAMKTVKVCEGM
jgi:hypothetical protein